VYDSGRGFALRKAVSVEANLSFISQLPFGEPARSAQVPISAYFTEIFDGFEEGREQPRMGVEEAAGSSGWSQPIWQRPLILLGFPEWRGPRYCQAILSQVRGEQGVEALDEGHAMYLISTVRKPAGIAVTPGGLLSVAIFRRQPRKV
jgi:hypothetical protein